MSVQSPGILRAPRTALAAGRCVREELLGLDSERDYRRISELMLTRVYGDPIFHHALLVMSSWRQVAVPAVATIIHRAGRSDVLQDTPKRIQDTLVFLGLMYRHGPESPVGGATIDKLSRMHTSLGIGVEDHYRHFVASIAFDPVRLGERLGVEIFTPDEMHAHFLFWRALARRWGITIDETEAELREWLEDFEDREFAPSEHATVLMRAVLDDFATRWFPGPSRTLGAQFVMALAEPALQRTIDVPVPSPAAARAIAAGVRGYVRLRRRLPAGTDQLISAWNSEYRRHGADREPDPAEVGPAWSMEFNGPASGTR